MPKVFLSDNDRLSDRLVAWIYGEMKCQKITQRDMAYELGISQAAFSQKLKNRSISFKDFVAIIRVLQPDSQEVDRLLGR